MVQERAFDRPATAHRGRRHDGWELICGYALIMAVIWTPRPTQRFLYIATVLYLTIVLWRSFEGPHPMGLRWQNLLRSLWIAGVAMLLSATAILIAIHNQTLHAPRSLPLFLKSFWGYALWSFVQQVLLVDFFLRRLLRLLPTRSAAIVAAAVLFASAHLPNPILTVVTLIMGLAACALFLHYRNLWPLALAHAILGITIAITVPSPLVRNMRVGIGYLRYKPHSFPATANIPPTTKALQ